MTISTNTSKALLFFIFVLKTSFAQVNTEAMRNSKDDYGFTNAFGFDLGFEKSNEEVVEIAGKYRLDYVTKNGLHSFLIVNYENGYQKEGAKPIALLIKVSVTLDLQKISQTSSSLNFLRSTVLTTFF